MKNGSTLMHQHQLAPVPSAPVPGKAPLRAAAVAVAMALALVGATAGPATAGPATADAPPSGATHLTGTYERLHADPPLVAGTGASSRTPATAAPAPGAAPDLPDAVHDVVRLADGTAVEVDGASDLFQDVAPGQQVAVTGEHTTDEPTVAAATSTFEGTSVQELSAAPGAAAVTSRTLAVVLLRLGPAGAEPMTAEAAHRDFFTGADSVAAYFRESSWSQLELRGRDAADGDVYGYLEIPADTACWAEAAAGSDAALAAGLDLSTYDHVAFVLDSADRGCWYGGWAYVGGQVSVDLYAGDDGTRAVAQHEIGHNLGLNHANALHCIAPDGHETSVEEPGGSCDVQEYGDPFDAMGNTWNQMQYSASYKARLGWIPSSRVTTVTSSGTYTLAPAEVATDQPQDLRIPLPSGGYYDLDVRRPYGQFWDAKVALYPALMNGVEIRRADDFGTSLVDATPGGTFDDAALQVGQTFTDPTAHVSVRTESAGPDGAVVHVELGTVPGGGSGGGSGGAYPSMTLRGTSTEWAPVPMELVAEHTWRLTTAFGAHPVEEFLLDVDGTGTTTFGDAGADGTADPGGPSIPMTQGPAIYEVTFHDDTLAYSVVRTW